MSKGMQRQKKSCGPHYMMRPEWSPKMYPLDLEHSRFQKKEDWRIFCDEPHVQPKDDKHSCPSGR